MFRVVNACFAALTTGPSIVSQCARALPTMNKNHANTAANIVISRNVRFIFMITSLSQFRDRIIIKSIFDLAFAFSACG